MKNNNNNPDILEQAFKQLYDEIREIAYRMIKNEEDAEDITGYGFLKLKEKKDIGSMTIEEIKAFLITTVKNKTVDYWRKEEKRKKWLNSSEAKMAQWYEEDWVYENVLVEYCNVLKKVILELGERQREVLLLRYQEKKSAQEISELLEISIHTVNNTIAEGKKRIRKKMEDRGFKF
jgi:RNA polymerase sigma factor (sigma-70 family)